MKTALRVIVPVLFLASTAALAAVPGRQDKTQTPTSKVVVFRFHGPLTEAPEPFDLGFEMEARKNLHELLERFRRIKKDDTVKAVVLTFDEPQMGLGQMQEIRSAITDIRASEKDVYCYLEDAGMGMYALAAGANKICLVPTGELRLMGMYAEQPYFKTLLDKIGVQADIEHVGSYKGAGEPFTRTEPSPEAKEMLDWLMHDIYDQLVEAIAKGRELSVEEVRSLIDRGLFTAKEAQAAKLVDQVDYAENFTETLKKRYGADVEFVHNYGAKKGPELDFSNIFSLFKSFGEMMSKASTTAKATIAVVYVDGMIVTGKTEEGLFGSSGTAGSTTLRRAIAKARDDENVKAVVLRVDSPGGSALASDIIWHATMELKEKKPLIVSMGNVAASGGYYVSAGAATIFADPGTLTGSIGVVGGKLVTKGLWDWAGINFHETKIGKNADLFNTNRAFNEQERAIIRKYMEEVYGHFTDRVKQGRGKKLKKDLDQLAGGRVYTGRQAHANGLVDKLGGLQDAIRFAAAEANVGDYEVRQYPEPKNFMDVFIRSLTGQEEDKDVDDVQASSGALMWTTQSPALREFLPMLRQLDPARAETVLKSLLRIELLGRENVLLVLPTELTLH